MNLPIIEVRFNKHKQHDFYKVKIENKFVWIDSQKFNKEVLQIDDKQVVCKEPFTEYFKLTPKSNQNGHFLVLEPVENLIANTQVMSEPKAIYEFQPKIIVLTQNTQPTKSSHKEKSKTYVSNQGSKYNFFKKLITNRYLSKEQFDKIIILSDNLLKYSSNNEQEKHQPETINLGKHKPQDTKEFLSYFSTDGLKFLVHDLDVAGMSFEYKTVIDTSKRYFDKFTDKIFLSKSLFARILTFAFNQDKDKTWSFNNKSYKYNWKHPEITEWCHQNPGLSPFVSEKYRNEMIVPFRQSIRVKERELWPLLQRVLTQKLNLSYVDFKIDVKSEVLDEADFYNDIEALIKGVSSIISTILERKDRSNKIKIEYLKKGRKKYLIISHVGSVSNKPLNTEILKGDLLQTVINFYRAYHYSIKALYNEQIETLHLLHDIEQPTDDFIVNYEIEGFTHIITL